MAVAKRNRRTGRKLGHSGPGTAVPGAPEAEARAGTVHNVPNPFIRGHAQPPSWTLRTVPSTEALDPKPPNHESQQGRGLERRAGRPPLHQAPNHQACASISAATRFLRRQVSRKPAQDKVSRTGQPASGSQSQTWDGPGFRPGCSGPRQGADRFESGSFVCERECVNDL